MGGIRAIVAVTCLAASAGLASAQAPATFTARLGWVPISTAEQDDVAGRGSAEAMLAGRRLSITGTFAGLPAAATRASLRHGVATGAGGPEIAALSITQATEGELSGDIELDRDAREALLAGHLYIQLHAERGVPPDGAVLRGWLLAPVKSQDRTAP